ncbi:MAG: glycosyltransferase family 2 protein [Deltaproteobacteria bacterium]|nr:MAG: glycosyltransferase family 2 protein [Deltaproteobacteria bacterium]
MNDRLRILFTLLRKTIATVRREGLYQAFNKAGAYLRQNRVTIRKGTETLDYHQWILSGQVSRAEAERRISGFEKQPVISIVMPVYNIEARWLEAAVDSVIGQYYPKWELCIVDDGSTRDETLACLKSINDARIRVELAEINEGISAASNKALSMASGAYVGFLDHDDVLSADALFEVVRVINGKDPDFIYSDEDKIDRAGRRKNPFFKPDWSPDLLSCQNYICHFTVVRKSLLDAAGGFRKGFEGAQDHDLFLRISEATGRIYHIPKILYSWRELDTSTAGNPNAKPAAQENALSAVGDHIKRKYGSACHVAESDHLFVFDTRFPLDETVRVSIIIPTRDRIDLLQPCVESILNVSSHRHFEIIIVDNMSVEDRSRKWFRKMEEKHSEIQVITANYPFCWSRLNNDGINAATGDLFIFLNNDTVVLSSDWIERLGGQALREDVGVVGPLMLYEDKTIQHAGVVVGMGGWADHVFKGMKPVHFGSPFVSPMVKRNVLAVTGSCMAISRQTINRIGNFNESFLVCGSDVEICIRAYEAGLFNIYDPFVKLFHFESKTRVPHEIPASDFKMSDTYYKQYRKHGGDPFFNKNLSLASTTPMVQMLEAENP